MSRKIAPTSATKVEQIGPFWRVTRTHDCADHDVVERKWFWRRETADRYARVWLDYRWNLCWKIWDGTYA